MRRKQEDPTLDLTPMIDVVFQLIIFFVVTVAMSKERNWDIELQMAPKGPEMKGEDAATFVVEVDRHGWLSLNSAKVSPGLLRNMIQNRYNRFGQFPVMIRGDYRTQHRDIRAVMDICSDIGIWKVSFVAIKEKKVES